MRLWLLFLAIAAPCLAAPATARAYALDHLATTNDIGRNKVPHLGTSHILVVPLKVYGGAAMGQVGASVK